MSLHFSRRIFISDLSSQCAQNSSNSCVLRGICPLKLHRLNDKEWVLKFYLFYASISQFWTASSLFMKSMLVIKNCWTDVIYSFDWYGLSLFTIHTGLSGEDLELRHTVFWCIYPSSRGDLFIRGTNYFFVIFFNDLVLCLLFDFFKSQTITSISCIFRPYLVSLTKDNEICYNVINNFIRKKYYRDYVN